MTKKKKLSAHDLVTAYMDYVLEHDKQPASVYAFTKAYNFEEAEFYNHFGSFETIEKQIFTILFETSLMTLEKSEDYQSYDARNKLLSFYFTFFQNMTANRSYILHALGKHKMSLKGLSILSGLKTAFSKYIDSLDIEMIKIEQKQVEEIQTKALQETAWVQLLLTLKFWMDDTSASFEKTDIFIEKSVNTSFDVLNVVPLKSMIDFGKFIFKEKMQKH